MYLVEALTNMGVVNEASQWMEPAAQAVLAIGLVDKVRKFTEKGK